MKRVIPAVVVLGIGFRMSDPVNIGTTGAAFFMRSNLQFKILAL